MLFKLKTFCPICRCFTDVCLNIEDYNRQKNGELIQNAMPYLNAEEREMLISGICPSCWNNMFNEEDEDDEDEDYFSEPEDLEMGFDPYLGDYTWDC